MFSARTPNNYEKLDCLLLKDIGLFVIREQPKN